MKGIDFIFINEHQLQLVKYVCTLEPLLSEYTILWLYFHYPKFVFIVFTPQPLRAVGVLFSPMVSGWAGGRAGVRAGGGKRVCPGCISETVRCRKLILGRDIG